MPRPTRGWAPTDGYPRSSSRWAHDGANLANHDHSPRPYSGRALFSPESSPARFFTPELESPPSATPARSEPIHYLGQSALAGGFFFALLSALCLAYNIPTTHMSKAKGRKRSNYGVSIYQEAPVVVQRKRKATEISIVENGVRVIGKASDGASAAAPAALAVVEQQSSSSNTNSVWFGDGLPQQQKEVTTGVPMRRTRSQDRAAKLRGSPMRPTISGIAEALGVDEPGNRAQWKPDDSTRALEFRPTISGLEEALEREAPILEEHQETANSRTAERLPSCAASTRTVALHACTD